VKRAKITGLPPEVRKWLEKTLSDTGYSGYKLLVLALAKRGFSISKSSIHRYGVVLQEKFQAIKDSTAAAAMLGEIAPDDANKLAGALNALNQTELFNLMLAIRKLGAEEDLYKRAKLLSAITGNISKLTRSSVYQKKHELEVRGRADAAAEKAAKIGKKGGLSAGAVDEIRREILGIAA
jgi:hypothetical protein